MRKRLAEMTFTWVLRHRIRRARSAGYSKEWAIARFENEARERGIDLTVRRPLGHEEGADQTE
jgi:hypothetical protein